MKKILFVFVSLFILSFSNVAFSQPTGTLTTNGSCELSQGATKCDIVIGVYKNNTPIACLWMTSPSLKLFSCHGHDYWSTTWRWANIYGHVMQLTAHDTFPTLDGYWPNNMQEIFESAPRLNAAVLIANPYGDGHFHDDPPHFHDDPPHFHMEP